MEHAVWCRCCVGSVTAGCRGVFAGAFTGTFLQDSRQGARGQVWGAGAGAVLGVWRFCKIDGAILLRLTAVCSEKAVFCCALRGVLLEVLVRNHPAVFGYLGSMQVFVLGFFLVWHLQQPEFFSSYVWQARGRVRGRLLSRSAKCCSVGGKLGDCEIDTQNTVNLGLPLFSSALALTQRWTRCATPSVGLCSKTKHVVRFLHSVYLCENHTLWDSCKGLNNMNKVSFEHQA